MSGFGVSWRRQRPGWLMTDATHRTSILKKEQQVFTQAGSQEKAEENDEKCWTEGRIRSICRGEDSERNEPLTTTAHLQKNGRLSCVDDPALVSRPTTLADGRNPRKAASRIM